MNGQNINAAKTTYYFEKKKIKIVQKLYHKETTCLKLEIWNT